MQAQEDVRVTVRVEKNLKENADTLFARLGMNMSVAFNVFLRKAVDEQGIPFPVGLRQSPFVGDYTARDITDAFTNAVEQDIAARQRAGLPIARYDAESGRAYLENADGTRDYVDGGQ